VTTEEDGQPRGWSRRQSSASAADGAGCFVLVERCDFTSIRETARSGR
jgi:hypothetical protein